MKRIEKLKLKHDDTIRLHNKSAVLGGNFFQKYSKGATEKEKLDK
jgi:hypothetical protein